MGTGKEQFQAICQTGGCPWKGEPTPIRIIAEEEARQHVQATTIGQEGDCIQFFHSPKIEEIATSC